MLNTHSISGRMRGTRSGWTMIELLVVIAIISILGVVSIPIMRMFARNDMRDGARTVYTLLRAARMYAMTYNVDTAVVYALDYPFNTEGDMEPTEDSVLDTAVRVIRAAAVMYRLPDETNVRPPDRPAADARYRNDLDDVIPFVSWDGTFVPVPGNPGTFYTLPQGYVIPLTLTSPEYMEDPDTLGNTVGERLYMFDYALASNADTTNYNRIMEVWEKWEATQTNMRPGLEKIGVMPVYAYPAGINSVRVGDTPIFKYEYDPELILPYMAHVFEPRGNLKTRHQYAETFRIQVTPSPDRFPEDRFIDYRDANGVDRYRLVGIPIEIHRATGRVRLGS